MKTCCTLRRSQTLFLHLPQLATTTFLPIVKSLLISPLKISALLPHRWKFALVFHHGMVRASHNGHVVKVHMVHATALLKFWALIKPMCVSSHQMSVAASVQSPACIQKKFLWAGPLVNWAFQCDGQKLAPRTWFPWVMVARSVNVLAWVALAMVASLHIAWTCCKTLVRMRAQVQCFHS